MWNIRGKRKSALVKRGKGTNFQGKTNNLFFRYYLRSLKKKANVTIKVENKEGY